MKLAIVLSTQPAKFEAATFKGNLEKNLAYISSLGYHGAELAIREPNKIDLDEIERLTKSFNLEVPAIGTGQAWGEEGLSFTDPDPDVRRAAINRVKEHIPVASRFNAVIIIGLLRGKVKPGVEHTQAMAWLIEALRECSQAASKKNVCLALEPINRYETTLINNVAEGLALVEDVSADNFGLLLDTFHMNIEESIMLCQDRIFHFHVADSNRWYPGGGHLDFRSIINTLFKTGYKGYISGEFIPKPDVETAAIENINTLNKLELARKRQYSKKRRKMI